MPIDPSISLQVQPPKIPSVLDTYGKAMEIKSLAGRDQLQQAQLAESQFNLSKMKEEWEETQAIKRVLKETPDRQEATKRLYSEFGERGVKVADGIIAQQKAIQALDDATRASANQKYGEIIAGITGIKMIPREGRPAAYKQALQMMIQNGTLPPDQVGKKIPAEYPGEEGLEIMIASAMDAKETLDLSIRQTNASTAASRANSYTANIESLISSRADSNDLRWEQLQRNIDRDATLDALARDRLNQALKIARMGIEQRGVEEGGRNTRAKDAEAGRTARAEAAETGRTNRAKDLEAGRDRRAKEHEAAVTQRAINYGASAQRVAKNFAAAQRAAKNLDGWDDMEEEQQSRAIDTLFDAFMENDASVNVSPDEGKRRLLIGPRKGVQTVTRGGASPAAAGQVAPPPSDVRKPKIGDNVNGYIFQGGDENDPKNWIKP